MSAPTPTPAPWLKWPPDKKIWSGGIAGIAAWVLLSVLQHFLGFDPQAMLVAFMGAGAPDIQLIVTTLVTLLVAHFTTPSVQDVVAHVNNSIVEIAAAEPGTKTTAIVVPEAQSDAKSKELAIAGALPADTVQRMVDAGVVSPKAVGNKP